MAINSYELCDKIAPKSPCSSNSLKACNLPPCRLVKINFVRDGSICSATGKHGKLKKNKDSPYLAGDTVQVLSRVTEKRLVHKKASDFVSSFPLAVNIYKANSDEFKSLKRSNRKVKKSVLTLPNVPVPMPEICTVSDMNDSEYFNRDDDNRKTRTKKRPLEETIRKSRARNKNVEYYDRDARYCSQLNIDLDCSSTDMIKKINGDGKRITNTKKKYSTIHPQHEDNMNPHDVWAVLRNINRFQFRPSPPMSEDSIIIPKNKKVQKRRKKRKDTRFIETCRTEEFAYISSYDVDNESPISFSQSSSFDRITVIDKQDDLSEICKAFEKRMIKSRSLTKGPNNIKNRNNNKNYNKKLPQKEYNVREAIKGSNFQVTPHKQNITLKDNNTRLNTNHGSGIENSDSLIASVNIRDFQNSDDIFSNAKSIKNTNDTESNNISINVNLEQSDESKGDFIYSGNSGSSKAAINNVIKSSTDKETYSIECPDGSDLKGKTKVVLSKGQDLVLSKRLEIQNRKLRLVTTMPSTSVIPKLTQTDIKRRLANMKFPIVILGKDQLSSAVHVVNNDEPLQFRGLDEHVWPFMLEWRGAHNTISKENPLNINTKNKVTNLQRKNHKPSLAEKSANKLQKSINEQAIMKISMNCKDKKLFSNSLINKQVEEQKQIKLPLNNNFFISQQPTKQKPKCQFKEKMLKLLYKKPSIHNVHDENQQKEEQIKLKNNYNQNITKNNKVDASTDTHAFATIPKDLSKIPIRSSPVLNKQLIITKHPWAKAKWASDFIENVIKKIKNGIYYNQETYIQSRKSRINNKEPAIQTQLMLKDTVSAKCNEFCGQSIDLFSKIPMQKKQDRLEKIIPGFENTLPALEFKTLNMNQIAVRHCVTNVMIQFDVAVPAESHKVVVNLNIKNSLSLIPVEVTDSQTKVFKCKTTILNAMLPAELCSILPKMMRNIMDSEMKLAILPVPVNKTESHLSTISELTHCDSPDPFKSFISSYTYTSLELRSLLGGMFSRIIKSGWEYPIKNIVSSRISYNSHLVMKILPKLSPKLLIYYGIEPTALVIAKTKQRCRLPSLENDECGKKISTCTTLQQYNDLNRRLTPAFKHCNVSSMLKNMFSYTSPAIPCNMNSCNYVIRSLNVLFKNNSVAVNMSIYNDLGIKKKFAMTLSGFKIDPFYNVLHKSYANSRTTIKKYSDYSAKCLENIEPHIITMDKNGCTRNQVYVSNKIKRKSFGKLYRKCKSTSSISGVRSCTLLSKITTTDDFFQALGMGKQLSSVFDCQSERKLMTSILQMKNWITEINPSQAFLVLLLTNKKDTSNLVRYRPILLQGIAVNRITRANELDMEIEVIERENLNKLPQYEGISYLATSVENHDNLLEELYWIAKTTASDYQKPFDESSEKHLKSLLEKRKKLNPSYLRVMARYVGLGLLKSPNKK